MIKAGINGIIVEDQKTFIENPYITFNLINKHKQVLPKPNINQVIQNRFLEKKFVNSLKLIF